MDNVQLQRGRDIAARLLAFVTMAIRAARQMDPDFVGQTISKQLIRSATSAGANYEEARGAESRDDFAHKVSIALKELRETLYWLRLIASLNTTHIDLDEGNQLAAILGQSIRTARANAH